jgi:hypothetical protein
MPHLVLLGDSIFDNAGYVPGGPSVIEHLRRHLPSGWRATLLAVDGSLASSVLGQLKRLPADATHLVVSAGGNNALFEGGPLLQEAAGSFVEVLARLAEVRANFQAEYRAMVQALLDQGKPLLLCTVYDCIPSLEEAERVGLSLYNELILREAFRVGASVLDLRLVCTQRADFAAVSPIEPSALGGGKIASAIIRAVTAPTFAALGTQVFI